MNGRFRGVFGLSTVLITVLFTATFVSCSPPHEDAVENGTAEPRSVGESSRSVVAASVGALEIRDPRAMMMPGVGAVYLEVANHSDLPDRLVAVETGLASAAETHESIDDDGVMRMVPRPRGFEVPADGSLLLEPSGKHIMLLEPSVPDGTVSVSVRLVFEQAGSVEVEVPIGGGPGGAGAADPSAMDHDAMDHGTIDHGAMNSDPRTRVSTPPVVAS